MREPQPTSSLKAAALGFFISFLFGFVFSSLLSFQLRFENVPGTFGLPSLISVVFSMFKLQAPSSENFDDWVHAVASLFLLPFVFIAARKMSFRVVLFPVRLRLSTVTYFILATIFISLFSYGIFRLILGQLGLQSDIGNIFDYNIAMNSDDDKFPQVSLLWYIPGLLVAPIYEELVFRGLLSKSLSFYLPRSINCIVTALIFACAHWAYSGDPSQMIVFILAGVLYFWAKEISGGFGLPIILHSIWNMCATTFSSHYIGS